jgi:uncharacterized radical SAM superfamily Fe-S cluster-containing enzyme
VHIPSQSVLKTTTSLCPSCLEKIPAIVFEREGAVFMKKTCPSHGASESLLASDRRHYWHGEHIPDGAGCCALNHSCTMIFEITEKCNLTCPTCFSVSSPSETYTMSVDDFTHKLDRLILRGKGESDLVQLSGGEPTIHPELERIVEICFERGIRKVYINTNGIRLAKDRELVARLAKIDAGRDRLEFYLQFDGKEERTHQLIRAAKGLYPVKRQAIANLIEHGLYPLPVMTVTRDINLHEVGAVVQILLEHHPKMNTLILQPAFYSGRYENEKRADRLTLAEVAHEVARQTGGLFSADDFGPIPCSHPNCFALAVAFKRGDQIIPVSRYFPRFETWADPAIKPTVDKLSNAMPQHMLELLSDDDLIEQLLDLLAEDDDSLDWADYRNFILIGIKPFMDAHTYDQDRIERCCVHIIDRQGEPVSLCEYNAVRRPRGLL